MNPLLTIQVQCQEPFTVRGHTRDIVMVPFTGSAEGELFHGEIVDGAVDTQKIPKGGEPFLSARYLIKGVDREGNVCQVFVENQGTFKDGFTPMIVTDSPILADWETDALSATVEGIPGGVMVKVYSGGRK